jgi:hypothetical protein
MGTVAHACMRPTSGKSARSQLSLRGALVQSAARAQGGDDAKAVARGNGAPAASSVIWWLPVRYGQKGDGPHRRRELG